MNADRLRKIAGNHTERRRANVWTAWRSRLFANGWPEDTATYRVALWTQVVAIWPDAPTESERP